MQDASGQSLSCNYCAYLVRLWQDGPQAAWRASAQPTHGGETVRFANLDALFAFLLARTEGRTHGDARSPYASDPATGAPR